MLCVGTVSEGKGHELLIDALAALAHLPWQLTCLGSLTRSPPRRCSRLRDRSCGSWGSVERVSLIGEVDPTAELADFYRAADLFVLATRL